MRPRENIEESGGAAARGKYIQFLKLPAREYTTLAAATEITIRMCPLR
jgi:hypothetical protein